MKIQGRIRRLSVGSGFPNECIHYQVKENPEDGDICYIGEYHLENGVTEYHIYKRKYDAMFLWLRVRNPYCVIQYFEQDVKTE